MVGSNHFQLIMSYLERAFWAVIITGLLFRIIQDRLTRIIKVNAKVIDKYNVPRKQYENKTSSENATDYMVAFDCKGRTKKFFVDLLVYDNLHKDDQGLLTYRGSHFIGFDHNKA